MFAWLAPSGHLLILLRCPLLQPVLGRPAILFLQAIALRLLTAFVAFSGVTH
jgi:hypothetical protein